MSMLEREILRPVWAEDSFVLLFVFSFTLTSMEFCAKTSTHWVIKISQYKKALKSVPCLAHDCGHINNHKCSIMWTVICIWINADYNTIASGFWGKIFNSQQYLILRWATQYHFVNNNSLRRSSLGENLVVFIILPSL